VCENERFLSAPVQGAGNWLNALPYPYEKDHPDIAYTDNLQYLWDVLYGKVQPANDLSSLENNLVVVRMLEAAKRSAKEGKRVPL